MDVDGPHLVGIQVLFGSRTPGTRHDLEAELEVDDGTASPSRGRSMAVGVFLGRRTAAAGAAVVVAHADIGTVVERVKGERAFEVT